MHPGTLLLAVAFLAAPIDIEYGPDTTVITGPKNADGTINYVAALNEMNSKGVAAENNAFVDIARIMPQNEWFYEDHEKAMFKLLGVDPPNPDALRFVPFEDFFAEEMPDEEQRESHYERLQNEPWLATDHPRVKEWVDVNLHIIDSLESAVKKEKYYSPLVEEENPPILILTHLPHLGHIRDIRKFLLIHLCGQLGRDDVDGAISTLILTKRFSRQCEHEPTFIGHLVGVVNGSTYTSTQQIVSHGDFSADHAERLIQEIKRLVPVSDSIEHIDQFVRFEALDTATWMKKGRAGEIAEFLNGGIDPLLEGGENFVKIGNLMVQPDVNISHVLRVQNRFMDRRIKTVRAILADPSAYERLSKDNEAAELRYRDALVERLATYMVNPDVLADGRNTVIESEVIGVHTSLHLVPQMAVTAKTIIQARMCEQLETIAAAVGAFHAQHGRFPKDLGELTPKWMPEIPADIDGAPLKYRVEGDTAVVYSVGTDLEDDGGVYLQGGVQDLPIRITRPAK